MNLYVDVKNRLQLFSPLSLDFDVQGFRNVRHDEVDQFADAEHDVLWRGNSNEMSVKLTGHPNWLISPQI